MSKKEEKKAEETAQQAGDAEKKSEKSAKKKDDKSDLEKQLADAKDQLLRTAAEYANFRARSAKEKEQTYSNAKGNVIADILPSVDNLERALSQENSDFDSLRQGVQMTLDMLLAALEKK